MGLNRKRPPKRNTYGWETLKTCSTSLTFKKMKIKNTLRFHLTPVRMEKINKTNDIQREQTLIKPHENQWSPSSGNYFDFLSWENQSISQPSSITLGHIPKELYILLQKYLLNHVYCCFIYNSQKLEHSNFLIWWISMMNGEWMWYIYTVWYYST